MKPVVAILLFMSMQVYGQQYSPYVAQVAGSANQLTSHLIEFEKLGIKEPGSAALNNTYNWLSGYYNSLGYSTKTDTFLLGNDKLYNLVSDKKGLTDKYIIVCGHYDTRTGVGSNDNGSGVSVIMEMARLLKNVETRYTIRFIHFSGEEVGLLGSYHHANNVVGNSDTNLFLVFNLDQLGGTLNASDNYKLKCEADFNNAPSDNNAKSLEITEFISRIIPMYTSIETVIDRAYASDYVPFEALGYIITGLYQFSNYPPYHTSNDFIQNMDTIALKEIGKGALAALMHISGATLASVSKISANDCRVYPNPNNGTFTIAFENAGSAEMYIYDLSGKVVYQNNELLSQQPITTNLSKGFYRVELVQNFKRQRLPLIVK